MSFSYLTNFLFIHDLPSRMQKLAHLNLSQRQLHISFRSHFSTSVLFFISWPVVIEKFIFLRILLIRKSQAHPVVKMVEAAIEFLIQQIRTPCFRWLLW
ncbi:hypothetical protein CDL12_27099 [Handroanthus impetiginosus]|uniref:Uncharacterized protein n=1 Tax=Handroanthus impetiginosus TaxID=429701 RepID=A0A2G9G510_9LAMI|nr:hypothetical protein CDL12_27099 [Handroanthus impetiginosus]